MTPDEIHTCDAGFMSTVYATATSPRDKHEYQLRTLRVPGGVCTTVRADVHKKRREALGPFFSRKNVTHLEPLLADKVTQLCGKVMLHAKDQMPANLSDLFFAFSNELMSWMMKLTASVLRKSSSELLRGININKHFPWLPDFLESLPLSISKPMIPPGLIDMLALFDRVRAELTAMMAAKASGRISDKAIGPTGKDSVYDSVLDIELPPAEKTPLRLEQEGSLLVLAGTESPARALDLFFYHVLSNPEILRRLPDEPASIPDTVTWVQLEKLPYLAATLEETYRLSWGVTARMARIAHEPLTYAPSKHVAHLQAAGTGRSYVIPAGTSISITSLAAHTSDVFPQLCEFRPDHWLGEEGRQRKKFQFAFSQGSRKCLVVELASAEMHLAAVSLLRNFDLSLFEMTASDIAFKHDYQVAIPSLDSKGIRVMVEVTPKKGSETA